MSKSHHKPDPQPETMPSDQQKPVEGGFEVNPDPKPMVPGTSGEPKTDVPPAAPNSSAPASDNPNGSETGSYNPQGDTGNATAETDESVAEAEDDEAD